MKRKADPLIRTIQAALLSWILPGAGHFYLGHRGLAWVFFVAITLPFVIGAAFGGVKSSFDPIGNRWLFLAELCVGSYTAIGWLLSMSLGAIPPERVSEYVSYYPGADIAMTYLATAGLMNVLVIFDAMTRAQTGGLPVFYPEMGIDPNASESSGAAP